MPAEVLAGTLHARQGRGCLAGGESRLLFPRRRAIGQQLVRTAAVREHGVPQQIGQDGKLVLNLALPGVGLGGRRQGGRGGALATGLDQRAGHPLPTIPVALHILAKRQRGPDATSRQRRERRRLRGGNLLLLRQESRDLLARKGAEGEGAAARADGGQQGGRALAQEEEDGSRGRLLQNLQQRVARFLLQPLGAENQQDAPRSRRRREEQVGEAVS